MKPSELTRELSKGKSPAHRAYRRAMRRAPGMAASALVRKVAYGVFLSGRPDFWWAA
tara:strand:- start:396 stop:566 length:171 start_codon:yes stop_codon:yes gene_type:complete